MKKLTADRRNQIREMVNILVDFLPLSSHNKKAITFSKIFKESNVSKYLKGDSKRQQLQAAWEIILKKHPRLPITLFRKIIPAAIDYRRYKRNPLRKSEIRALIKCLDELDINLKKELKKIKLDETLPIIKVPSKELLQRLINHPIAIDIQGEPIELFKNGHYNEAVRKASEKFEMKVQSMSGLNIIGKDLMGKSFNLNSPIIKLNDLKTENEKGIQEGYQFMTMGLMRGIRNIFSHGDENQKEPEESYEMLIFINWLFRMLAN